MRLIAISKACTALFVASLGACSDVADVTPPVKERMEKRLFDIPNTDSVVLTSPDDVTVITGDKASATASGDPRALNTLVLSVENGVLQIGRTKGNHSDNGASITITLPTVRRIEIRGSGDVDAVSITSPVFQGRVSGSGSLRVKALTANEARLVVEGSGDMAVLNTDVDDLFLNLSGVGDITTTGQAGMVSIDLNGSGTVDSQSLETPKLAIALRGSGTVSAYSSDQASVQVQGTGDASVVGGAKCSLSKNSLSEVTCT